MNGNQLAGAPSMLRDSSSDIRYSPPPVKIDLNQSKVEFDCRKELEKMAGGSKNDELVLSPLLPSDLISGDVVDVAMLLLTQARQHIENGEFAEALKKLDEFLAKQPGHPDGTYLWCLCHLSLDRDGSSFEAQFRVLRAIADLRKIRVNRDMADRINMIVARVRSQVRQKFLIMFLLADHRAVLRQLLELIRLDPDCEDFTFFSAVILTEQDKLADAYECVEAWSRAAGGRAPTVLAGLKGHLEERLLRKSLQSVIRCMKSQDYSVARCGMSAIDARLKSSRDYQLMDDYLRRLEGGGGFFGLFGRKKTIAEVPVRGSVADRVRLQDMIVREEIDLARQHLNKEKSQEAEAPLNKALQYMPDNPFASYLKAGCTVERIGSMLVGGKLRSFDDAIKDLEACRMLLKTARGDLDIKGVDELAEQVEILIRFIGDIDQHVKSRREDVRKVNALIEAFVAIMEEAKKGIDSRKMLLDIHKRLGTVERDIAKALKEVKDDEGHKVLQDLAGAVENNMAAVDSLKRDVENPVVEKHATEFRATMQTIPSGGFTSHATLMGFAARVNRNWQAVTAAKRQVKTAGAMKKLEQIEGEYQKIIKKITEV